MNAGGGRTTLAQLPRIGYEALVRDALRDDLGTGGDVTSEATIPAGIRARGELNAREAGVLAGLEPALLAFTLLDPGARFELALGDGDALAAGARIATIEGDARALLGAERTALNLLSHLSGIASGTARYVARANAAAPAGRHVSIIETRKTLPGLRALAKYAVRAGGGANHRYRLDDAILIKDNHVALAGGVAEALRRARERAGHLTSIEIEVDSLEQLDTVLAQSPLPTAVLLDNFSPAELHEAVARASGRVRLEASGGITLETIDAVAASGVDIISIGALTHSVRALDIGLDITVRPT